MNLRKHQSVHALVVVVAAIMIWRGVWGILDNYLFPSNPIISSGISVLLGLGLLYLIHFKIKNLE